MPPPPQRPARPVRLATPSTGYPFPLMMSRQNSAASEVAPPPARVPSEKTLARRAMMNANDGWGTPASTATSSEDSAPGLSSAFSDSDTGSSSSACSTPVDDDGSVLAASPLSFSAGGAKSPLSVPHLPPHTPDDVAHSRSKHAGSTPGAPPPAPLVKLDGHRPVAEQTMDMHDVKEDAGDMWEQIQQADDEAEKTPPSLAPTPPPPKVNNPLASGLAGLRMSDSSDGQKRESGVGSKWEID